MSTVSQSDRATWQSARTLAEVGELTARWIEGSIGEQPQYRGPSDIEDPARLVPVLARLNRAGLVTTASSSGESGPGYDGEHWQQRAAVEAFASPGAASALTDTAADSGLIVVAFDPATLPRRHWNTTRQVPVTLRAGEEYTWFGQQWCRREICGPRLGWGICNPAAIAALCSAWQVTVIDPEWGRADLLWDVLEQAVTAAACPHEICHHNHPELPQRGGGAA